MRCIKKDSAPATNDEHDEILGAFGQNEAPGNGFHECCNFHLPSGDQPVQIYLPPTGVPGNHRWHCGNEFVVFSFTYGGDLNLPNRIVGVHAGVTPNPGGSQHCGLVRTEPAHNHGERPLNYHAVAPKNMVTLFLPPIEYDRMAGIHTPVFQNWGFGLRNLNQEHAAAILQSALVTEADYGGRELQNAIARQRCVIRDINLTYGMGLHF